MLPPEIANETVTRLRGTVGADSWGDRETTWASPNSLTIAGCSVQPVAGGEDILTRDSVTSRWTLFAPPDADIRSDDRIRHRGVEYEVDGSVQEWPALFGLGHKEIILRRVDG